MFTVYYRKNAIAPSAYIATVSQWVNWEISKEQIIKIQYNSLKSVEMQKYYAILPDKDDIRKLSLLHLLLMSNAYRNT